MRDQPPPVEFVARMGKRGTGLDEHTTVQIERFTQKFDLIATNVEKVIQGKRETVELITMALVAEGHVLVEDVPGVGKTLLAKSIARSIEFSTGSSSLQTFFRLM